MKTLRCLLIDDEAPALRLLQSYVQKVPFLETAASTTNPIEALTYLEREFFDIVLLDIQMPTITGIQLSKLLPSETAVIFTTAYPQFAIESYELNATDYLLKPFEFERFYQAVLKVKTPARSKMAVQDTRRIFVKTDGKNNFEQVNIQDIHYIESLKNYVAIGLEQHQIITYNTLKHYEQQLPNNQFIKVHKSYIVSMAHIAKTDSQTVYLQNGKNFPIGDTYKKHFFQAIQNSLL